MAGTIEINGTGGIIEGNLGAANVNVNLDSSLSFDGSDDNINIGDITVLDGDGSFTQTAWAKFASDGGGNQYIAWKDDAFGIALFSNFRIRGYIYYSGGNTNTQFNFPDTTNGPKGDGWIHVASSYDGSNLKLYVNGDLKDTVSLASKTIDNSTKDFKIGGIGSGTQFKGEIADVRLYSSTLTDAEIKTLASKINIANEVVQSTSTLVGWWKLNNNSITDSSTNSNNGTATGTTQIYDDYSVDVYDNSTTTDGTFTITQGKVEGLALSSIAFDGTNDRIDLNDSLETWTESAQKTFAAWVYNDGNASTARIFNTGFQDSGQKTAFGLGLSLTTVNKPFAFLRDTSAGAIQQEFGEVHSNNTWMHYAIVQDGANDQAFLYQNGILQATVSSVGEINQTTTVVAKMGVHWVTSQNLYFDGKIRDVRLYDYNLSDEQVSSLYSKTYPQTPQYYFKLDEGSVSGQAINSGTISGNDASFGGMSGTSTSGGSNGTLDLDGTLTIAANGTLSAPRGDLACNVNFTDNGTFTHNSGEVKMQGSGADVDGSATTTFFNLTSETFIDVAKSINVENKMKATGSNSWRFVTNQTITMGTATSAGEIETGTASGKGMRFTNLNKTFKFEAANPELFPWVGTDGGAGWNVTESGNTIELKGCDMQFDFNTQGSGGDEAVTWKLTGDCEFDAVTVSSGDTLDLNSQRAEFGGNFSLTGTLSDTGNAGIAIFKGTYTRSGTKADLNTGTVFMIEGAGSSDYHDPVPNKFFVNAGSGTVTLGNPLEVAGSGTADVILGSGTINANNQNITGRDNITIATGGTYTAGSSTLTCKGDFTTSGGLLGASALETVASSSESASTSSNYTVLDNRSNGTIEFWLKLTDISNNTARILNVNSSGSGEAYYVRTDGSSLQFHLGCTTTDATFTSADNSLLLLTNVGTKFHHYALVKAEDVVSLYIDGKKAAQKATSGNIQTANSALFLGQFRGGDSNFADMVMDELRFYTDARTESEIRSNMFTDSPSGDNLVGHYKFDEGTGTTVADSSSNSNALTLTSSGAFAGAGTFTYGTSTLNMTGADSKIRTNSGGNDFFNIGLAPSGGTTTFEKVKDANVDIHGLLTHNGGTMAQSGNVYFTIKPTGMITAGATIPYIVYWQNTTDNVPSANFQFFISNAGTEPKVITFGGNCTFTGYLRNLSGNTLVMGPFTHSVKSWVSSGTNTFDLRNSTINAISDGTWTEFRPKDSSTGTTTTLITGNTNINGHSSGCKWLSPPEMNCEIVGNVSNLIFQDAGEYSGYNNYANDITIVGSVTDCSGVGFRQFHHTLDTQQLLDADEAGDDDLRLEKPALDNANELQTG